MSQGEIYSEQMNRRSWVIILSVYLLNVYNHPVTDIPILIVVLQALLNEAGLLASAQFSNVANRFFFQHDTCM